MENVVAWKDIGTSFLLEGVQSCEIKKGRMGAMLCNIIMKNGTSFKCKLPDSDGPNGDLPHHNEYREKILPRLSNTEES